MLRTNLATRPFYNERGVYLLLGLCGLLLLGLTAFNASSLVRLSAREAELTARTSNEEKRSQDLRQEAAKLRASVRQDELDAVLEAAREANALIDERTFSWTALFNYLEATLPEDVMLTAVRPIVEDGLVTVNLGVIGRRVSAIDDFMTQLEETTAFRQVLSRDERALDDNAGFEAVIVSIYAPPPPGQAPAAAKVRVPEAAPAPARPQPREEETPQ